MSIDLHRLFADAAEGPTQSMDFADVVRRGYAYRRRRAVLVGAAVLLPLALLAGSLALTADALRSPTLILAGPAAEPPPAPPEAQRPTSSPQVPAPTDQLVAQAAEGLRVLDAQLGPLQPVYPKTLPANAHLTGAHAFAEPRVGYGLTLGEIHPLPREEVPAGATAAERIGTLMICAVPEQATLSEDPCDAFDGQRVERTAPGWRLTIVASEPLDPAYAFATFWRDVTFTADPAPIASTAAQVMGFLQFPTASSAASG